MKTTKTTKIKRKVEQLTTFPGMTSIPSFVLIKKTFIFDLCTIKRLVLSVSLMVLVPALILLFIPPLSGEQHAIQLLGLTTWYYNFAIMFPFIIIGSAGPLISEELRSGTMLMLVSKPINRVKIFLSKFIALYIFGIVISFLSLSIISILAAIKYPFDDIPSYLGIFFIYSLIILFFFGGITMGFSSLFKRPRNVLMIPLALVIFSFLVIMMFKPLLLLTSENWYEKYYLYNFDIGYHFANVFLWIGESFVPQILNYFEFFFWMFGITKMIDYDHYEKTEYYPPLISFFYLIVIAGILLVIGILMLKKRDITG
jgi:ABC-type transport system involved in multi-copper enzyme maturation permease subunit